MNQTSNTFDYGHPDFANRYLVESTNKRTSFRALRNTDYNKFRDHSYSVENSLSPKRSDSNEKLPEVVNVKLDSNLIAAR